MATSVGEQSKKTYGMFQATYDEDGNQLTTQQFFSNYSGGSPASYGDYQTDHITNQALAFLGEVTGRSLGDGRRGRPFAMMLTPTAGHTPFTDPPVYTPDATNRAARMAVYDTFTRDVYDTATIESGTSTAVGTTSVTVIANTPTVLIVGEWLLQGSGHIDSTTGNNVAGTTVFDWTVTSAPSQGSYTLKRARPDIDQTNSQVTGNLTDERRTGKEMVAVDDMLEAICAYLENQEGQYALANTYIIYTSDNSIMRGEKGIWDAKGFPPDSNFRVPFIIRGPGIAAGVVNTFQMGTVDIMPTVFGLIGFTPTKRTPDGVNLAPYFTGEQPWSGINNHVMLHCGNPSSSTKGCVSSRYRYHHDTSPPAGRPTDYIYNWRKDPMELRNLYGTAEVGAGTGVGGGSASIQQDLINIVNAHYNQGENGAVLRALHYP
jgi:arylsulfatase A-like enzyme